MLISFCFFVIENNFNSVSRQENSIKMNELYGQIAELKGQVIAQGNSESKTIMEKTSLHKQIENLNDNVGVVLQWFAG